MYHAQFVVHCRNKNDELSVTDFIAICRIGSNVRKTQVFASFSNENESISYQSLQWAESSAL